MGNTIPDSEDESSLSATPGVKPRCRLARAPRLPDRANLPRWTRKLQYESIMKLMEITNSPQMSYILNQSIESVLHDILLDIHQEEKTARMQTAVVELETRAEKLAKQADNTGDTSDGTQAVVETKAATLKDGQVHLKGNPMKTVKHIRCPHCRLPRLLYPRVGFNSRPVPDVSQQYCKAEPNIILDKHDVHGQRRKGVKVKGQAKAKTKKKNEPGSPAPSEASDPLTPSSSMPDSFEFKEIDYPAAKCPNRESHLGDHWKSVNVFATHLHGSCYLKRDRAAGREAREKISGTPRDSRASSPKAPAANGIKRKAAEEEGPSTKKKQKTDLKKTKSAVGAPSKLREASSHADDGADDSPVKAEPNGDTISVATKARDESTEPAVKLKFSGLSGSGTSTARKKPSKPTKRG